MKSPVGNSSTIFVHISGRPFLRGLRGLYRQDKGQELQTSGLKNKQKKHWLGKTPIEEKLKVVKKT